MAGSVRPGVKVGMRNQPEITEMKSTLDPKDDDADVPDLPPPSQTGWLSTGSSQNPGQPAGHPPAQSMRSPQKLPSHINATVPNPEPAATPMVTADMVSLSLPSRFAFYPFKDLYIKPLRVTHLAKLARANDLDSMQIVCEVISSLLATHGGHTNVGFKLCIADFQAVLYWLRANSYPKSTMRITSTCQNHEHHKAVSAGQLLASTLTTESSHDLSGLESIELEHAPDPSYFKFDINIGSYTGTIQLRPETMYDSIQFLQDERYLDPEFQYVARLAAACDFDSAIPLDPINGVPQMWTLQDKMKAIEEYATTANVMLIEEFNALVDSFGVNEIVNVRCKECGHVGQVRLAIDARTFPSPAF